MEVSTTTNILNAGFSRRTTASDLLNSDTFGIGNGLRITPINSSRSSALNSGIQQENNSNLPVNAFGIGSANRPDVELSPQARILQQNESNQQELAQNLQEARENARDAQEEASDLQSPAAGVSTVTLETEASVPEVETSTPSLQSQRATSLYQSVQSFT